MTAKEAYKILGLPPGTELQEIKKRYRQLMMQVHPDVNASAKEHHTYHAQEINRAYSVLKKEPSTDIETVSQDKKNRPAEGKNHITWDAPINVNAYMDRDILHSVEMPDGSVLGNFCIARGEYLWTTEEDFPLFLLSVYQCSKQLLDEIDSTLCRKESSAIRHRIQTELAYLLAQQFIDGTALLKELAKEKGTDKEGHRIFYISSMLESSTKAVSLKPGEPLYPSRIKRHRLYLKNKTGQELGYLSFPDDRFYYIVVPLFEQHGVQIKVQAAERQPAKYQKLHLWIKLRDNECPLPENLNLQIEHLLEQYRQ